MIAKVDAKVDAIANSALTVHGCMLYHRDKKKIYTHHNYHFQQPSYFCEHFSCYHVS